MKKRKVGYKFSRGQGARKALYRSLVKAFVAHGKIETTKTKAKFLQRRVEKLINLAKENNAARQRQIYAILGNDRKTTTDLFGKIAPLFSKRTGGYTRLVNLPLRRGDAAEMAKLEWTEEVVTSDEKQVKRKMLKKMRKE